MTENIFNRDYGLDNLMDPNGNYYGVEQAPGGQSLYFIGKKNSEGGIVAFGSPPDAVFESLYTHKEKAITALKIFLTARWDHSDRRVAENLKKAGKGKETVAA